MLVASNKYLDKKTSVYNTIPVIVRYKNDLTYIIDSIRAAAQDQDAAQVFISESKDQLKRLVAEKMDILDDTVEAYAEDVGDTELASIVSNSMSNYYRLPDERFETKVKNVIAAIETHFKAMADYGMTQEMLDDVKLQFDLFSEARGKPRAYKVESRIATQDLETLFKEATTVIEKLDKVIKRFKRSNAPFYNGYLAARTLVDN